MCRIIVVSNRTAFQKDDTKHSSGGLASALQDSLLQRKCLWFGWSGKIEDERSLQPKIYNKNKIDYALIALTPQDYETYYLGFSNEVLWPSFHSIQDKCCNKQEYFQGYLDVNHYFAQSLGSLLMETDYIWIHDYHLLPLGYYLRKAGFKNKIGYFHHIPWPPMEILNTIPNISELALMLCAYDLIGLQTERDKRYALQFFENYYATVPVEQTLCKRRPVIKSFPVGIDTLSFQRLSAEKIKDYPIDQLFYPLPRTDVTLLGVERLDYSKGIYEKLLAIDLLFENDASLLGKVSYIQIGPPSRCDSPTYRQFYNQIVKLSEDINLKYSTKFWKPIHRIEKSLKREWLAALYRQANVCLVTPIQDGMNLVSKEYIAAQNPEEPGILILSNAAGAAEQLTEAVQINSTSPKMIQEAIAYALTIPLNIRQSKWKAQYNTLLKTDLKFWAKSYIEAMHGL